VRPGQTLRVAAASGAIALALFATGCGSGTAQKGEPSGVKGLAQQGGQSVAKVEHALHGLKHFCTESEADLANEISKTLSDVNSHGSFKLSATELIGDVEAGIGTSEAQDNSGREKCKRTIAALSSFSG
jgi:hypothetical protein